MYAQVEKPKENKSRAIANSVAQKKNDEKKSFGFVDNRPMALTNSTIVPKKEGKADKPTNQFSIPVTQFMWPLTGPYSLGALYSFFFPGNQTGEEQQTSREEEVSSTRESLEETSNEIVESEIEEQAELIEEDLTGWPERRHFKQMSRGMFLKKFISPSYELGEQGLTFDKIRELIQVANQDNYLKTFSIEKELKQAWRDGRNAWLMENAFAAGKEGEKFGRFKSELRIQKEDNDLAYEYWFKGNEANHETEILFEEEAKSESSESSISEVVEGDPYAKIMVLEEGNSIDFPALTTIMDGVEIGVRVPSKVWRAMRTKLSAAIKIQNKSHSDHGSNFDNPQRPEQQIVDWAKVISGALKDKLSAYFREKYNIYL